MGHEFLGEITEFMHAIESMVAEFVQVGQRADHKQRRETAQEGRWRCTVVIRLKASRRNGCGYRGKDWTHE